jgi:Spy/CpxP family protein refolding chaperone
MKRLLIAWTMVGVLVLGVAYVYADDPGYGPGRRGGHPHESWGPGKDYQLTPEQRAKFQELRRKFRQENAQLIGSIVGKKIELRSLWTDPKADPKAILDKEKELRALQDQMKDKTVQMRLEARKSLTPEQIANWKPRHGMGYGGGMGRRGMMRPGGMMGRGGMMAHGAEMGMGMGNPGHGMCQ